VADRGTGRLIGGSVIGEDEAGGRINVIASALQNLMRVEDFEQLDLAYSPPFATVWDPLLIAAQQLTKACRYLLPHYHPSPTNARRSLSSV
jgi:hypothetical protein